MIAFIKRMLLAIVSLLILATLSAALYLQFRPLLAESLKPTLDRRFPVGTESEQIIAWAEQTDAKVKKLDTVGDMRGHDKITTLAGIDENDLSFTLRAKIAERNSLLPDEATIYFFFNSQHKLMKIWIYDSTPSL
jgi:hypothetical protein